MHLFGSANGQTSSINLNGQGVSFRTGQIFFGKVLHLDSYGYALVQLGSRKITAKIEAPLDISKSYWFQVTKRGEEVQLKLLPDDKGNEEILKHIGLLSSKESTQMLSAVKQWNMPVDRTLLLRAVQWLKETDDLPKAVEVVKWMIREQYPFRKDVFFSLLAILKGSSLSSLIERLTSRLSIDPIEKGHELESLLRTLSGQGEKGKTPLTEVDWGKGKDVYEAIRFLLKTLGFDTGGNSVRKEGDVPLKELLQQLFQRGTQLPKETEKTAKALYHRLCGGQLFVKEQDSYIQWTLTFPLPLKEKWSDARFHWQGKKGKDGKLDQHFCRILFDLDMPHLGKTIVHMNVQNRIVSLHIKSEGTINQRAVQPYVKMLKENLENYRYNLSSVQYETVTFSTDSDSFSDPLSFYRTGKVDIKI